ncbi:MAG TPA: hypothetical protein PLI03_02055 [Chitinophagales bacterium]|nr:hypothetical protein [Chitinophagales bacterium]
MRNLSNILKSSLVVTMLLSTGLLFAQQPGISHFRGYDKNAVNMFETSPQDVVPFTGIKVRVGGGFTQVFQALSHENVIDTVAASLIDGNGDGVDDRKLYNLSPGFDLAEANLNLDVQLADGIRLSLETYLSTRHHSETWVKGGYIQVDKLPFGDDNSFFNENMFVRVGHMEINYGDAHFRRSDAGNTLQNPFMEGYILDAFTTEIGGELYYNANNILVMLGMTSGEIKGNVLAESALDPASNLDPLALDTNKRSPSILAKLGYDNQMNDDLRIRLTGSMYYTASSSRNTLYGGDRSGSDYHLVMENTAATADTKFTSGRYNPGFTDNVMAIMINPFVKFQGLEVFITYEMATGRSLTELAPTEGAEDIDVNRAASQIAADLIYRFGANEDFYIGGRYNTMTADYRDFNDNAEPILSQGTINRIAGVFGWFVTDNVLAKAEFVTQSYEGFPETSIFNGGKFSGIVLSGSVGF